jgi:transcriptional regulator with XRE-family HTH domain
MAPRATHPRRMRLFRRFARQLAGRVRRERAAQALTRAELAQRVGVGVAVIRRIETATGNPSLAMLVSVARALRLSLANLLGSGEPGDH